MYQKNLFLLIALIFISFNSKSQTNLEKTIFSNSHGLKQGRNWYFESEGYAISAIYQDYRFDKRGIKKVKKKFKIDKSNDGYYDSTIHKNNRVFIQHHKVSEKLTNTNIFYLTETGSKTIYVIGFSINTSRDKQLEEIFVKNLIDNTIPQELFWENNTIYFVGRQVKLGSICRWMAPHNMQCPDFGQMNWSEHRSKERAQVMIDTQIEMNLVKPIGKILQMDTVDMLFEGKETKALKIKYKIKVPRLIMGGSNILIIYCVVAEVRNKYVACVFSQYTDDVNARKLAPLLAEFMELK